jgi:hypothetical protein
MAARPRMTIQVIGEAGSQEVQVYLNPEARQWLIAQLNKLDRQDDHFHAFSFDEWDGLQLSDIPYSAGDKLACALKVLLRYDDWDAEHFPHVMEPPKEP